MSEAREILKRPMLTEKGSGLWEKNNQYAFEVSLKANKIQIKRAVEAMFDVKVTKVTTMVLPGKPARLGRFEGRKPPWKRALVTLREGDRIEAFEKV